MHDAAQHAVRHLCAEDNENRGKTLSDARRETTTRLRFMVNCRCMKNRMTKWKPPRKRVTVSLPSDLVRRLDRQSRSQGASRSGLAERWLRAGERQDRVSSLEQELEQYYSRPAEPDDSELPSALGRAARAVMADDGRRRATRRRSSR